MDGEPLDPLPARNLIRKILDAGGAHPSQHAYDEMAKDNLTMVDVANVLRGGRVEFSEFVKGTWRYRVQTRKICVVVAFRSEAELRVVTAWRNK